MVLWARHSDRTGERTWHVVVACLAAAVGLALAGFAGSGVVAVVAALTLVNIGISSAKPPLWSMPTMFLSGSAAAAGIATINSIGNLGGFVGPAMIGWIKDLTGSFVGGLYFVAALLVLSAVLTLARSLAAHAPSRQRSIARPNAIRHSLPHHNRETFIMQDIQSIAAIPARRHRPRSHRGRRRRCLKALAERDGRLQVQLQDFRLGLGLLQEARRDDAGRRRSSSCKKFDAIFSARSARPTCPTTSRCGACACRSASGFDQYANVRPTRILPGITSPAAQCRRPAISTG